MYPPGQINAAGVPGGANAPPGCPGKCSCPEAQLCNFIASPRPLLDRLFLCFQNMNRKETNELVELPPAPGVRKALNPHIVPNS